MEKAIGPTYWDAEPEESSLPFLSSSAIELVEASVSDPAIVNPPLSESSLEREFFTASPEQKAQASEAGQPATWTTPANARIPWLLFILAVSIMLWAASEVVAPRFRALDQAKQALEGTRSALAVAHHREAEAEARALALAEENRALQTEREAWQTERTALAEAEADREALTERLATAFENEPRVKVVSEGNTIGLRILVDDLFVSGSTVLAQPALLDVVAGALAGQGDRRFVVVGHSDSTPIPSRLRARFPSNWELSAARALAVTRHLETRGLGQRLAAQAAGSTRPLADEGTREGKKQNRRIEILVN